jgi:hypothetical protein
MEPGPKRSWRSPTACPIGQGKPQRQFAFSSERHPVARPSFLRLETWRTPPQKWISVRLSRELLGVKPLLIADFIRKGAIENGLGILWAETLHSEDALIKRP